jgi:hypothetical protein
MVIGSPYHWANNSVVFLVGVIFSLYYVHHWLLILTLPTTLLRLEVMSAQTR